MTALEAVTLEKGDKRASESRKVALRVAEEVRERRRRFFEQALSDREIIRLVEDVLALSAVH